MSNCSKHLWTKTRFFTATLQADLAQAYAEKASLEEELASARLAIERHQRQSKHETNRLNSEVILPHMLQEMHLDKLSGKYIFCVTYKMCILTTDFLATDRE